MPKVILHVDGTIVEQEVNKNANLVVLAGIRQFPKLKYGCGIGKCTKCACKIMNGAEAIAPPNWKEIKQLGDKIEEGFRLTCQFTISEDLELSQDNTAICPPKKPSSAITK